MLDIHAPGHPVFGIRDFFIHLLTITAGLLIALGLEAGVEAMHHRHQRIEADANLRSELGDNIKELAKVQATVPKEEAAIEKLLQLAEDRTQHKQIDIPPTQLGFDFATLHHAAWGTASATGVLNYMDYSQVQRFAEAYEMQIEFVNIQDQTLQSYLDLQSHIRPQLRKLDLESMSPQDLANSITNLRHTLVHLIAMQQVADALRKDYDKAIQ
jgi:hypothetical protein